QMRHLYVVVDTSRTMEDQDLKPNRLTSTLKLLEYFVEEYFDQNPISQMGIITTKNKRAEKLTDLAGNPKKHIADLKKAKDTTCVGEPSLYNSLSLAMQTLRHMPGHASREVLVIFSSLTTCDPANIYELIKSLKALKIRVSVIGLSAEVRVCTVLTQETGGTYHVILDESHYKELLQYHVKPHPASSSSECSLIRMGNPKKHIADLKKAKDTTCVGEPSLYNSLSLAMQTLRHMPGHASREVLVIFSSLTTCDPANIYELIKSLKALKIRVSVIGLSAEVRVCTVLTRETGGTYHVILDESHYKELLQYHVKPHPASSSSECSLIRMGTFPVSLSCAPSFEWVHFLSPCLVLPHSNGHLDSSGSGPSLTLGGYYCPQCRAKYTELPVECKVCGLTLVSAPHLARSFHHLFPLDPFTETPFQDYQGEKCIRARSARVCSVWSVISSFTNPYTAAPPVYTASPTLQASEPSFFSWDPSVSQ
ncbi:UNVERIFIED_CONTAM: hypothetical protein FKN15_070869, partial [Acipenser sinensis]